MSGHEVMVQRITAIIAELYQYGFVSCKKMMDEFNISERTLYRDLNRLGDRIVPDGDGIYRLAPAYAKPQALKNNKISAMFIMAISAGIYCADGSAMSHYARLPSVPSSVLWRLLARCNSETVLRMKSRKYNR